MRLAMDLRNSIKTLLSLLITLFALSSLAFSAPEETLNQWHQWRGPLSTGVAPRSNPPLHWSETKNIRWKTEIPGKGHSTPAIWGNRVFLTTAIPYGPTQAPMGHDRHGDHDNFRSIRRQRFQVLAIDRNKGSIVWTKTVANEQPHEGAHVTGSWASASPITDGKRIFAFFGSRGLYCLDWNGGLLWKKNFGDMHSKHGHGEGASPVLYRETLVINWDHEGSSFIVALDKRTGHEKWRVKRDEVTSWSTPIVVHHKGPPQVIVSATGRVRGYDLNTGKEIWACGGLSHNVVASPVFADGVLYVGSSYEKRVMMAIKIEGAQGDISNTSHILWRRQHDTPYVPSPILTGEQVCFHRHLSGVMTCADRFSGETIWGPLKLPGLRRVFASPVGAAGRIYSVSREGKAVVLERGPHRKVLAQNKLDDSFTASPSIVGDELYLRGEKNLYCIAKTP